MTEVTRSRPFGMRSLATSFRKNIAQSAKKIVFAGTFAGGGLKTRSKTEKMRSYEHPKVRHEGRANHIRR